MLIEAAQHGRTEEVIALLDAGVNINATDKVSLLPHVLHVSTCIKYMVYIYMMYANNDHYRQV